MQRSIWKGLALPGPFFFESEELGKIEVSLQQAYSQRARVVEPIPRQAKQFKRGESQRLRLSEVRGFRVLRGLRVCLRHQDLEFIRTRTRI